MLMLLEFLCSNHKSIRNEVLFSAIAGKNQTHEDRIVNVAGVKALKSAVIYGANGSGKSNFIDAIDFVKRLVMNSVNHQLGAGINQTPHKLDGFEKESTYRMQFVTDGVRYAFGFTLKNLLVTDEYLYYFPNGRQTKIYERDAETFSPGNAFRSKFNACKDVLKPNKLMLSCAANFSTVDEVAKAFRFFCDELVVYRASYQDDWMKYSLYQIHTDERVKKAVIAMLQELGTGVKDISVKIDKKELDPAALPPFFSDDFKKKLLEEKVDAITAKVVYDSFETDLLTEESTGVKKLFGMLCPLIDIMVKGKVLLCDELESNLHESLVFELVRLFVNLRTDNPAQLIFTTHETGLLNLDLFRRDQIWFTELSTDERATDLYSLAEIKNVRKEENYGRGYIAGKYGAIPMLNVDFAKIVSEM